MLIKVKLGLSSWEMPEVMLRYTNLLAVEMRAGKLSVDNCKESTVTYPMKPLGGALKGSETIMMTPYDLRFVLQYASGCCNVFEPRMV